ncbi:MAG: flagellar export chaperone FliS [Candidatus Caldarchaeum sp.]
MMPSKKEQRVKEYQKTAVATASPLQLVLMLYDSAIRHCERGMTAIQERDIPAQHEHLTKAQRILSELTASLDLEAGGEIAKNLFSIYAFCINSLVEANLRDDADKVRPCIHILQNLRASWNEVLNAQEK